MASIRGGDPPESRTARAANPGGGNTSAEWAGEPNRQNSGFHQHRQARDDVEEIAIYDGRRYLGVVYPRDRCRRFDAFDRSGAAVGRFIRSEAAARSIWLAHIEQKAAA